MRSSYLLGLLVVASSVVPGCSGTEFSSSDDSAGDGGESAGEGGTTGKGGSGAGKGGISGAGGSDTGGGDTGGGTSGGNGGSSRGGNGGTNGGSSTGGEAGESGGTGGSAVGGTGGGGSAGKAGSSGQGGTGGAGTGGRGGSAGSSGASGSGGASGKGGSGGKGGTGGVAGSGGALPAGCPPMPPSVSMGCSGDQYCTYGTHPFERCRDRFTCVQGNWQRTLGGCAPATSCSDTGTPVVVGAECQNDGLMCQLDQNVTCLCGPDCPSACSFPPIWHCLGPPAGCPPLLPNHGQPCSGSANCTYGNCRSQTAVNVSCEIGAWRWRAAACPN